MSELIIINEDDREILVEASATLLALSNEIHSLGDDSDEAKKLRQQLKGRMAYLSGRLAGLSGRVPE